MRSSAEMAPSRSPVWLARVANLKSTSRLSGCRTICWKAASYCCCWSDDGGADCETWTGWANADDAVITTTYAINQRSAVLTVFKVSLPPSTRAETLRYPRLYSLKRIQPAILLPAMRYNATLFDQARRFGRGWQARRRAASLLLGDIHARPIGLRILNQ